MGRREIWEQWKACITLDARSLALARIATGLVLFGDLLTRLQSFRIFYTDDGILPRQALYDIGGLTFPSIYAMSGWQPYLLFLFAVHGLIALSLAAGYRTRLSGVLAWYFTVSLQERMYMANNGGDKFLGSLLFWAMFLPWGEAFSVDARGREEDVPRPVCSAASAIFLLQPVMVYWVSVFHKLEPTWISGRVLSYALQSDFYGRPVGQLLLPYPEFLRVLAYATFAWELIGPALLLAAYPPTRAFACVIFMVMHFGFGVFLRLGTFQFSPMLYMIGILPAAVWGLKPGVAAAGRLRTWFAGLANRLHPPPLRPVVLGRKLQGALSALFLYVFLVALSQDQRMLRLTPEWMDPLGHLTGLYQRWSVFVDTPNIFDGWLVVEATMANGKDVDLFQGYSPTRYNKPDTPYHRFTSFRWPTPLVIITGDRRFHRWFARGLARDWTREHPEDKVEWVRIIFYQERPKLDYTKTKAERVMLWEGRPE